jgi:hypothetical protein
MCVECTPCPHNGTCFRIKHGDHAVCANAEEFMEYLTVILPKPIEEKDKK